MRIIDKDGRKDYYDCVQRYDEDRELIYQRNNSFVKIKNTFPNMAIAPKWSGYLTYRAYIIGFAGKTYPYLHLTRYYEGYEGFGVNCYSIEEVDEWVMKEFSKNSCDSYFGKLKNKKKSSFPLRKKFSEAFDIMRALPILPFFHTYSTPIFELELKERNKWERGNNNDTVPLQLNPILGSCFSRILDTYQAYQSLSMYLGSLAQPNKPIPVLDDITMRDIKGFNKWSFKKTLSK